MVCTLINRERSHFKYFGLQNLGSCNKTGIAEKLTNKHVPTSLEFALLQLDCSGETSANIVQFSREIAGAAKMVRYLIKSIGFDSDPQNKQSIDIDVLPGTRVD